MSRVNFKSIPSNMTDDIKFTYDDVYKRLIIKDGNDVKIFNLPKGKSDIFYYILKAIDLLDDGGGSGSDVYPWAEKGNLDKIPNSKLNIGTEAGQIPILDNEGELPTGTIAPVSVFPESSTVETSDDGNPTIFIGGTAL